ncbi:hypothetical protein H4Q26_002301, partial [Puccinia striiformis f. sp. tritici PST-130]
LALPLEHAQELARKKNSVAYLSYGPPELLDQLDKFKRRMIAWPCKMWGNHLNRPAYDNSCGNLLAHTGRCQSKQQKASGSKTLACVGVTGTSDLDPARCCNDVLCGVPRPPAPSPPCSKAAISRFYTGQSSRIYPLRKWY